MKIPNKTLKKWLELKEEGDIALLAEKIGKSEPTVYSILRSREAKVEDVEKINEFFKDRQKRVNAILTETDND